VPLCALQIPYVLAWYGTQPSAVTGRRLTGSSHVRGARSSSKPARHRTKVSADEWTSPGAPRSWRYKMPGCRRSEAFRAAKIHPVVSCVMGKCGPGQHLLPPCSSRTPKEAIWCSKTLVATYQTTRCRNSKHRNRTHYTKNSKITAQFCIVLKTGRFGKQTGNTWKVVKIWCWNRMVKMSWNDRVKNEEYYTWGQEYPTYSKKKANWIGHILRKNCILQHVIKGKIQGRARVPGRRGRRRKRLLDDLKEKGGSWKSKEEALYRILVEYSFWKRLWSRCKTVEWTEKPFKGTKSVDWRPLKWRKQNPM